MMPFFKFNLTFLFSRQTAACHSLDPLRIPGPVSNLLQASFLLVQGPYGASFPAPGNLQAVNEIESYNSENQTQFLMMFIFGCFSATAIYSTIPLL